MQQPFFRERDDTERPKLAISKTGLEGIDFWGNDIPEASSFVLTIAVGEK